MMSIADRLFSKKPLLNEEEQESGGVAAALTGNPSSEAAIKIKSEMHERAHKNEREAAQAAAAQAAEPTADDIARGIVGAVTDEAPQPGSANRTGTPAPTSGAGTAPPEAEVTRKVNQISILNSAAGFTNSKLNDILSAFNARMSEGEKPQQAFEGVAEDFGLIRNARARQQPSPYARYREPQTPGAERELDHTASIEAFWNRYGQAGPADQAMGRDALTLVKQLNLDATERNDLPFSPIATQASATSIDTFDDSGTDGDDEATRSAAADSNSQTPAGDRGGIVPRTPKQKDMARIVFKDWFGFDDGVDGEAGPRHTEGDTMTLQNGEAVFVKTHEPELSLGVGGTFAQLTIRLDYKGAETDVHAVQRYVTDFPKPGQEPNVPVIDAWAEGTSLYQPNSDARAKSFLREGEGVKSGFVDIITRYGLKPRDFYWFAETTLVGKDDAGNYSRVLGNLRYGFKAVDGGTRIVMTGIMVSPISDAQRAALKNAVEVPTPPDPPLE